jgi:hypothetical protein
VCWLAEGELDSEVGSRRYPISSCQGDVLRGRVGSKVNAKTMINNTIAIPTCLLSPPLESNYVNRFLSGSLTNEECSDNDDDMKLQSHSSNNVMTNEEGSGKERSEQGPPT